MNARSTWITVVGIVATSGIALANDPPADKSKQIKKAEMAGNVELPSDPQARKRLFRALVEERYKVARERGAIFSKIAVQHDYSGEYVVFRDEEVTGFLDLTDPQHPRYSARGDGEEEQSHNAKRRSHVLVIPNQPRENVGKTLTSEITAEDLDATLRVVHAAEALAKRLSFINPRIYLKPSARVGVGYLHVHIVGERDSKVPYPPALK